MSSVRAVPVRAVPVRAVPKEEADLCKDGLERRARTRLARKKPLAQLKAAATDSPDGD
jgi:hypothetical protein